MPLFLFGFLLLDLLVLLYQLLLKVLHLFFRFILLALFFYVVFEKFVLHHLQGIIVLAQRRRPGLHLVLLQVILIAVVWNVTWKAWPVLVHNSLHLTVDIYLGTSSTAHRHIIKFFGSLWSLVHKFFFVVRIYMVKGFLIVFLQPARVVVLRIRSGPSLLPPPVLMSHMAQLLE